MYRDERKRNEEFSAALKSAQQELAQSQQIQAELEIVKQQLKESAKTIYSLKQDISKTDLYKATIKKQEKVISKLEALMENTFKDTEKARNALVELEQLKTENLNIKNQLKKSQKGDSNEAQYYKKECERLEGLINNLREELKSKRPVSVSSSELEREKMELEVKLLKANARVEALQNEMTENAKNFAKEISTLKMMISVFFYAIYFFCIAIIVNFLLLYLLFYSSTLFHFFSIGKASNTRCSHPFRTWT